MAVDRNIPVMSIDTVLYIIQAKPEPLGLLRNTRGIAVELVKQVLQCMLVHADPIVPDGNIETGLIIESRHGDLLYGLVIIFYSIVKDIQQHGREMKLVQEQIVIDSILAEMKEDIGVIYIQTVIKQYFIQ